MSVSPPTWLGPDVLKKPLRQPRGLHLRYAHRCCRVWTRRIDEIDCTVPEGAPDEAELLFRDSPTCRPKESKLGLLKSICALDARVLACCDDDIWSGDRVGSDRPGLPLSNVASGRNQMAADEAKCSLMTHIRPRLVSSTTNQRVYLRGQSRRIRRDMGLFSWFSKVSLPPPTAE